MSKPLIKEDVIKNKKESIKKLNGLLEHYINEPSGSYLKKANLISYWLKDYVRYIDFEEKFNPKRNIAYKRGNVVKVSFGFNVGSEYGGLHYGVVLDNNNNHGSSVVTVIPLTSVKDEQDIHKNSVELGNEIYRSLKIKYTTILAQLNDELKEIDETRNMIDVLLEIAEESLNAAKKSEQEDEVHEKLTEVEKSIQASKRMQSVWDDKEKHTTEELQHLEKIGKEIAGMKEGSIALINQITTISKMRIFDPKNIHGVLFGISLTEESMEKINEKVKELYVF